MNGAQDLGGMMGFGPVLPEKNEPIFHAEWEKRALGVTLCCGALGEWNIDTSRHARETLHPADYLSSSYYEIWTKGLLKLLAARGLVSREEIAAGRSLSAPKATRPALKAADVPARLASGGPCDRPLDRAPRCAVGDQVRTRNMNPTGHTRLPRYARGKRGVIEARQGSFVFPDTNAHGKGEDPQWIYSVVFKGQELWGAESDPGLSVAIDCWEPYLEPA
ncbi:nitrile hydratase subunit beta [Dongia sedimenti]|uniref:Nitrile hydratase subunit beta n=1 Tax=Dongia sedimenti TaxID=3064282 RepID=A0ABU0YPM7_9PROT|nr:nitrile hydratase subunit beta [Rhodospirillaceae bacterium R-7]